MRLNKKWLTHQSIKAWDLRFHYWSENISLRISSMAARRPMPDPRRPPVFTEPSKFFLIYCSNALYSRKLVSELLRAFGDNQRPHPESVRLLDDILVEFITEIMAEATQLSSHKKVTEEEILFVVRKNPLLYARLATQMEKGDELKELKKLTQFT